MNVHARRGGLSVPAYVVMLVVVAVGYLLEEPTNGRSWGVLAVGGVVVIVDILLYVRRSSVREPEQPGEPGRALLALAGMAAGAFFIVMGVLTATGTVEMEFF